MNGYCDNTLTHESSCRFAESITDAERIRVRGGEWLHLLGRWFISVQLNNANSLRHSDMNQKKSSRTINKMLASSDVYIVAHKLTRDEGKKKKKKRFIDTVLTIDYFCPNQSHLSRLTVA